MIDKKPVALVVEDDHQIRRFLQLTLGDNGYQVFDAQTAADALKLAANSRPDIVLLDLGLPDLDGIEVAKQIREWSDVPIIVLSARGQEDDKIKALDAGADDYLIKPFSVGELFARMRSNLRRSNLTPEIQPPVIFEIGHLKLDRLQRQVFVAGQEVHLTPNEYKLLTALVKQAGRVMTQHQLLKEVWGSAYLNEPHYLRVYMAQLRNKLEKNPSRPEFLLTEQGIGYRLKLP